MASARTEFKLALVQMRTTGGPPAENAAKAVSMIAEAAKEGAQLVVLPELFTVTLNNESIANNSEPLPGPTSEALAKAAKDNGIYIVGGSMPVKRSNGKIYNTCTVFDPEGKLLAVYEKIHLFDVDIPGGSKIRESDVVSPGSSLTCFETPYCKVGVILCYDLRFGELAQLYAQKGCKLLVCPAAVVKKSGGQNWDALMRTRAADNQLFLVMAGQVTDDSAPYLLWGHSSVICPRGQIIAQADDSETILYADIDLSQVDQFRAWMPLTAQRRPDIYRLVDVQSGGDM